MDEILKQKITDKLRKFLNREPEENEIINGQTDVNILLWIYQDEKKALENKINKLEKK